MAHGKDRTEALFRIKQAIREYTIEGLVTTMPFGIFVFEHEAFISGNFDTQFVKYHYTPELIREKQKAHAEMAASCIAPPMVK